MTLTAWQGRLCVHFKRLHETRLNKPVFALEHGLEPADIEAISVGIRAHIAVRPPSREHALPWIVYSAEMGYRYAGDEYWQTFANETPGWKVHGDRDWIRDSFAVFHKQFGGAKPSGPWARHFSIICWPITHAILPRDLQRQLAEILYYIRDSFSADLLGDPLALGKLIASRSWTASSRFQILAEEPLLLGQIATALLLQGTPSSESLILPTTLKRIANDLSQISAARLWLRDAQRVAQQRIQFRGLSSGNGQHVGATAPTSTARAREQISALAMDPRLLLRPIGDESWQVLLQLPDFSNLLVNFPATRTVLLGSRCTVTGSSGRPLARGALLHGPQHVVLRKWPSANEMLIRFEQAIPSELEYLLRADCLLQPGPRWLFKVGSDGLARELRANTVRAGQSYVVASSAGAWKAGPGLTPLRLDCEDIYAARLDVPTAITADWPSLLEDLGLTLAGTIAAWPAGLVPCAWDGESRAEWLTTERPCVAIMPDHAVDWIVVTLGAGESQRIRVTAPPPGLPFFVELPQLSVGVHKLVITARPTGHATKEYIGHLDVVIREPRTWVPGTSTSGALRVTMDPPVPTLEEVWEGRVAMDVRGPTARKISPTVALFERGSDKPLLRKGLPQLDLPISPEQWRAHFRRYFRNQTDAQNAYDPAQTCRVELDAAELGTFRLDCEREFSAIRWVVRRHGSQYYLTLLDDRGSPQAPTVFKYDFITPNKPARLDSAVFSSTYAVPTRGGLYRAHTPELDKSVIVPPTGRITLQELTVEPKLGSISPSVESLEEVLSVFRIWLTARLTGFIASTKKQLVLGTFLHEIFRIIGGDKWARAEHSAAGAHGIAGLEPLSRLVSTKSPTVGSAILRDSWLFSTLPTKERVMRFAVTAVPLLPRSAPVPSIVRRRGTEETATATLTETPLRYPHWICEFVLRLASSPESLRDWAGSNLKRGLEVVVVNSGLARAARLLVMAVNRQVTAPVSPDDRTYAAWEWE